MSRYNLTTEEEKHEQLLDLIRVYDKTLTEILFLESHLNSAKSDIIHLMEELKIENKGKVKLVTRSYIYVDPVGIAQENVVKEYAMLKINREATIGKMYRDNIDYKLAEAMVDNAIKKHTVVRYDEKDIEI